MASAHDAANRLFDYKSNQYFAADTLSIQFNLSGTAYFRDDSSSTYNFIYNGINAGTIVREKSIEVNP